MKPRTLQLIRLESRFAPAVAIWDGGSVVDFNWTTPANWVGDVAPSPGDDLVFPGNAVRLTNPNRYPSVNDFPAGTAFGSLRITHVPYELSGNAIALGGGIVFQDAASADPKAAPTVVLPITLTSDQTIATAVPNFSLIEARLAGPIDLNGQDLTFNTLNDVIKISGDIAGTGSVTFARGETYVVSGHNTFTGPTVITGGVVDVQGSIAGPVTVIKSIPAAETTTLLGSGSVGDVTVISGAISNQVASVGTSNPPVKALSTGNLALSDAATGAFGLGPVGGIPITVTGTVRLAGTLGNFSAGFAALPVGERRVLIANDGTDLIVGTFANAPEGNIVGRSGDVGLRITYRGGDGNDLELTNVPLPTLAVGAGPGGPPTVKVYDSAGGLVRSFSAYESTFQGGVHVVTAELTGDFVRDVITAPGAGGGPHIRIWDGATGALVKEVMAYDPAFRGGVNIAASNIVAAPSQFPLPFPDPALPNIITGAGPGGGPHVKVFDVKTLNTVSSFFAFDPAFRGGVTVAGTNASLSIGGIGGGFYSPGQVIAGAGPGGVPLVRLFFGTTGVPTGTVFMAYDPSFRTGVNVAWDGHDIVTAPGSGGPPLVRSFLSTTGYQLSREFMAYDARFLGGVNIAARPLDPSGGFRPGEIVTGPGPGGGPHVRIWPLFGTFSREFFAFDPAFRGGVFVG